MNSVFTNLELIMLLFFLNEITFIFLLNFFRGLKDVIILTGIFFSDFLIQGQDQLFV